MHLETSFPKGFPQHVQALIFSDEVDLLFDVSPQESTESKERPPLHQLSLRQGEEATEEREGTVLQGKLLHGRIAKQYIEQ